MPAPHLISAVLERTTSRLLALANRRADLLRHWISQWRSRDLIVCTTLSTWKISPTRVSLGTQILRHPAQTSGSCVHHARNAADFHLATIRRGLLVIIGPLGTVASGWVAVLSKAGTTSMLTKPLCVAVLTLRGHEKHQTFTECGYGPAESFD